MHIEVEAERQAGPSRFVAAVLFAFFVVAAIFPDGLRSPAPFFQNAEIVYDSETRTKAVRPKLDQEQRQRPAFAAPLSPGDDDPASHSLAPWLDREWVSGRRQETRQNALLPARPDGSARPRAPPYSA